MNIRKEIRMRIKKDYKDCYGDRLRRNTEIYMTKVLYDSNKENLQHFDNLKMSVNAIMTSTLLRVAYNIVVKLLRSSKGGTVALSDIKEALIIGGMVIEYNLITKTMVERLARVFEIELL